MELTVEQDTIIRAINKIREKHHACTAKSISAVLRLSNGTVLKELVNLEQQGKVTWTNLPGSIRTIPETKDPNPKSLDDDSDTPSEEPTAQPTKIQPASATSPKARPTPTKKATSSKKKPTRPKDQQS
jgi:hypothetical protein